MSRFALALAATCAASACCKPASNESATRATAAAPGASSPAIASSTAPAAPSAHELSASAHELSASAHEGAQLPEFPKPSAGERRTLEEEAMAVLLGEKAPTAIFARNGDPRARVTTEAIVRAGAVPEAQTIVAGMRGAIRACYERAPLGSGEGQLTVHTDPPLDTTLVGTSWSGDLAPITRSCIEDRARRLSFGEGAATVVVTMTITPP